MYECPNCGGNMKFDIPSQQLKCEQCHSLMDPYSCSKEHDAESSQMYEATVFTCPQCGGEIIGSETSAAEFCSFCGASTILSSRISSARRPNYIIPFSKTKDDCKKSYSALMKKAFFAPKELKDEKRIDSFRAIYVPYWAYHIDQNGDVLLSGEKTFRRGNYIYTNHFKLGCTVNAYYKGMTFDASSTFDDSLSESIAPYDVRGMKEFTPSILSGFYADISDVDCNIYIEDAEAFANNNTYEAIENNPDFFGIHITAPVSDSSLSSTLNTSCQAIDSAMFPVYFMSYRKGGRVAYAVVNGQTGKVTADIPVDRRKYILFSLLMAIPIFLLLNLLFTVKATTVISVAAVLSVITQLIYMNGLSKIMRREMQLDDKGFQYSKDAKVRTSSRKTAASGSYNTSASAGVRKKKSKINAASVIIIAVVCIIFMSVFMSALQLLSGLILPVAAIASFVIMIFEFRKYSALPAGKGFPVFLLSFAAVLACVIIRIFNPVSDIWYYSGAILVLAAVIATNIAIINKHNILSTRRLPQFNRKGGDDRA